LRIAILALSLIWIIFTVSMTDSLGETLAIAALLAGFYGVAFATLMLRRDTSGR
jgi:hypothetical protein